MPGMRTSDGTDRKRVEANRALGQIVAARAAHDIGDHQRRKSRRRRHRATGRQSARSCCRKVRRAPQSVAPTLSRHVPGFSVLLDKLEDYGVRTVIVEDASRFARDVQAHILGIALLRARGVRLLATNGDKLTDDTDEMTEGMLTIAAVFSQIVA